MILFGSHAKGVADLHSDYDFCFVYNPKDYAEEDLLLKLTKVIIFEMRIVADILVMTEKKLNTNTTSPIVHEIRTHGIAV
jgi:predicted nucleotidyltransferase